MFIISCSRRILRFSSSCSISSWLRFSGSFFCPVGFIHISRNLHRQASPHALPESQMIPALISGRLLGPTFLAGAFPDWMELEEGYVAQKIQRSYLLPRI